MNIFIKFGSHLLSSNHTHLRQPLRQILIRNIIQTLPRESLLFSLLPDLWHQVYLLLPVGRIETWVCKLALKRLDVPSTAFINSLQIITEASHIDF